MTGFSAGVAYRQLRGTVEAALRSPAMTNVVESVRNSFGFKEPEMPGTLRPREVMRDDMRAFLIRTIGINLMGDPESRDELERMTDEMMGAFDRLVALGYTAPKGLKTPYDVTVFESIVNRIAGVAGAALATEHSKPDAEPLQMRKLITLRDCSRQVISLVKGEDLGDFHDHTEGSWMPGTNQVTWPRLPAIKAKKAGTAADALIPVGTIDIFPDNEEIFIPLDGRTVNALYWPELVPIARDSGWWSGSQVPGESDGLITLPDERPNVLNVEVSDDGDVTVGGEEEAAIPEGYVKLEDLGSPDEIALGRIYTHAKKLVKLADTALADHSEGLYDDDEDRWEEVVNHGDAIQMIIREGKEN